MRVPPHQPLPPCGRGQPLQAGRERGLPQSRTCPSAGPTASAVETPPAPRTPRRPLAARSREGRGRKGQGLAARAPARPGAERRPVIAAGQRPRRAHRPRRHRRRRRQGAGCCASRDRRGPAGAGTHLVTPGPIEQAIPHEAVKLSNIRKTIARRLTESKQQVPHIYLTVDIQLDALLKLRGELNKGLEPRGIKLSVNDLMIKALAHALIEVPECNVSFAGDQLFKYSRADVSVAVSIPAGLITPIIVDADAKSVSAISTEMKDLAARAKEGKLQPHEYQGGTASLSNMGMYGIKNFEAVINPPQGMIMAIGAGEKRPYVINDSLQIATVMSATGSFDHRAIDGADGAKLMQAFKRLVENPLGMLA